MKKLILLLIIPLLFSCNSCKNEEKVLLESSKPTTPEIEKKTKKNQQTIQPFDKIKSH